MIEELPEGEVPEGLAVVIPPVDALPWPSDMNDWICYWDPTVGLTIFLEHALVRAIGIAAGILGPLPEITRGKSPAHRAMLAAEPDYRSVFMAVGDAVRVAFATMAPDEGTIRLAHLPACPDVEFAIGTYGGRYWAFLESTGLTRRLIEEDPCPWTMPGSPPS